MARKICGVLARSGTEDVIYFCEPEEDRREMEPMVRGWGIKAEDIVLLAIESTDRMIKDRHIIGIASVNAEGEVRYDVLEEEKYADVTYYMTDIMRYPCRKH